MGLNELAYQIFSERMEEFATRNERMALKGNWNGGTEYPNAIGTYLNEKTKKVYKSQLEGVKARGGSQDAPKYKGAKESGRKYIGASEVVIPATSSKLRAYLKYGSDYRYRKNQAIKSAKEHEGAHDRRRAYNEENQKKYLANKDINAKLKANGYI